MKSKKRIAIIGAGISGLSSAYHLHQNYEITIFEKEDYFGGHTDTHELNIDNQTISVDSGFIVFCRQYYPHFTQMLDKLGVDTKPTDMSFSAYNQRSNVVYNATSLNKLFCQRRNLFRWSFYRMLLDLIRFYRKAPAVLQGNDTTTSVKEYLEQNKYSREFIDDHLFPMISALWSATPERVEQFPIRHLIEFLHKHGMMKLVNRPQWLVVKGGSQRYIDALKEQIQCQWHIRSAVTKIKRSDSEIELQLENGDKQIFDAVVIATHSDQALRLLEDASENEQSILGAIDYELNEVIVHTDETVMHPNKQSWASWNTEVPHEFDQNSLQCCTANYWMNLLQGLPTKTNIFSTLNSHHKIREDKVLKKRQYAHPIFTADSVAAQKKKSMINGHQQTFYVGAYWGWGFHEDGARSAYETAELIKAKL